MWEIWVRSLDQEDPLEKEMATHSSILAWRIPWTEEPGGLQSTKSQTLLSHFTFTFKLYIPAICHLSLSFSVYPKHELILSPTYSSNIKIHSNLLSCILICISIYAYITSLSNSEKLDHPPVHHLLTCALTSTHVIQPRIVDSCPMES